MKALEKAGIAVVPTPADIGITMKNLLDALPLAGM